MSLGGELRIAVRAIDRFTASVVHAQQSLERWFWRVWWDQWGTDGWKRRTALVAVAVAVNDVTDVTPAEHESSVDRGA